MHFLALNAWNCQFFQNCAHELYCVLDKLQVADENNDPQMQDFIESEFLEEQVSSK